MIRRALLRIAIHINLGPLTPWLLGLALGRKPVRKPDDATPKAELLMIGEVPFFIEPDDR